MFSEMNIQTYLPVIIDWEMERDKKEAVDESTAPFLRN